MSARPLPGKRLRETVRSDAGRPRIALEDVTARRWWPDVRLGSVDGPEFVVDLEWGDDPASAREQCWLFARDNGIIKWQQGLKPIVRVLIECLRPEFHEQIPSHVRLMVMDTCVPRCINPWHQSIKVPGERPDGKLDRMRRYPSLRDELLPNGDTVGFAADSEYLSLLLYQTDEERRQWVLGRFLPDGRINVYGAAWKQRIDDVDVRVMLELERLWMAKASLAEADERCKAYFKQRKDERASIDNTLAAILKTAPK